MTYLIVIILLTLSALFSGLNLGLMSLSPHELKRKMSLGDKKAKKIYSIRKTGNLLLVTLLVGNVATNATLSIFLESLVPSIIAGIIATLLITIFGEITPQAVFARFALELGSKTVWLVKIFIFIFYPVCKPLAVILDKVLGEELPTVYSRQELVKILEEHSTNVTSDIMADEEAIAKGALTFGNKKIKEIMTPRSMVTCIEKNKILSGKVLDSLINAGYSRYPVFEKSPDNIIGIIYSHELIKLKPNMTAGKICGKAYYLNEEENLDRALNAFLKTKHHLFIVINKFSEVTGVLSIEDVLEEIIGKEIIDEFDKYDNVREVAERFGKKKIDKIKNKA